MRRVAVEEISLMCERLEAFRDLRCAGLDCPNLRKVVGRQSTRRAPQGARYTRDEKLFLVSGDRSRDAPNTRGAQTLHAASRYDHSYNVRRTPAPADTSTGARKHTRAEPRPGVDTHRGMDKPGGRQPLGRQPSRRWPRQRAPFQGL